MAKSLVTKIVEDHMVEGSLEPAEEVGLKMEDDEVTLLLAAKARYSARRRHSQAMARERR
jgi:hypothetical protein